MPYARTIGMGINTRMSCARFHSNFFSFPPLHQQFVLHSHKWPTSSSTSLSTTSSASFRKRSLHNALGGLPLVTATQLSGPSNQGRSQFSAAPNIVIISYFRLDLHENSEKNLVTASFEFPGVSKEDIQLDVANGKLTVSAETKQSTEHSDEGGYAVRERRFGKFSRTLQLPQGIKVS